MAIIERMVSHQKKKEIQLRLTKLAKRTHKGQKAALQQGATKEVSVEEIKEDQEVSSK